jgi:methylthioribose-1-phosphate isomerase
LAVLARHHQIPFYVAAPFSTVDMNISSGKEIIIEEREHDEIRRWGNIQLAPEAVKVYNPAFDVTPNHLITAIITDFGIAKPPFLDSILGFACENEKKGENK